MTIPAERIGSALAALAVARGGLLDEAQAVVYLRLLQGSDPSLIERACEAIAKERRPEFDPLMPAVGTILARAQRVHRADAERTVITHLLPLPQSEDDAPVYFCRECLDESSGWHIRQCQTIECGRPKRHAPHPYAIRCECWRRNPVVHARHQREQPRPSNAPR